MIEEYIKIIEDFLQNRIDVFEFEKIYWDKFMNDKNFPDEYYEPLNRLLTDIDEFEPDEELKGDDTVGDLLSEEDLRKCAGKALKQIALLILQTYYSALIYFAIMLSIVPSALSSESALLTPSRSSLLPFLTAIA